MKAWSKLLSLDFLLKRLLAHFMTPVFLLIAFMAHSDATHCSETFRALVKGSTVARGTIDSATSASSRTGRRTWGVEYTFTGWNGRTYKGSQRNLSDRDWKVGAHTAVYYDGVDPGHNALDVGQLRLTAESDNRAVRLCLGFALLTSIFQIAVYWRRYKRLTRERQVDQSGDALVASR